MIFLKNILKKSTIKWYLISLISIITALLLFWSLNNYLNLKQKKLLIRKYTGQLFLKKMMQY